MEDSMLVEDILDDTACNDAEMGGYEKSRSACGSSDTGRRRRQYGGRRSIWAMLTVPDITLVPRRIYRYMVDCQDTCEETAN